MSCSKSGVLERRRRLQVDSLQRAALLGELRTAGVVALVDTLVLGATQLLAQLVDREIQSRELVAVGRLGPHDGSLAGDRELDRVVFHPAVVIRPVGDLHVDALRARGEVLDAGGLLFDDRAEAIRHVHSHADDAGFHP